MNKLIVTIFYSERDRAGNCYWAFTAHDPDLCKEVSGKISGNDSNIRQAEFCLRGRWPNSDEPQWHITTVGMKWRKWNALTAGWPYAGCAPKDILTFIQKELAPQPITTKI